MLTEHINVSRRLRIILAVTSPASMGLVEGFGRYLSNDGWDVHIISSTEKSGSHEGVTYHEVPMAREPSLGADLASLIKWVKLVIELKPDIVSAGTPKAGFLGMLASFIARVPRRTYMLHGLRLETETGIRYKLLKALERLASSVATDVLTVSPSLRARVLDLGLVRPNKVFCLGKGSANGVDMDTFSPSNVTSRELLDLRAMHHLDNDVPVVGFVGRLTPDKGIRELAAASRLLHNNGVPHQLLVVGAPEFDGLDDVWEGQGLVDERRPFLVGRVKDVRKYLHLMDVFVLPTYREGLGTVLIEAAACGIPAVTTNATGAKDAVVDGQTGFRIDVGDSEALAAAIHRIISDTALSQRMSESAVSYARKYFDRKEVWRLQKGYYLRSLGQRGK